jgi:DNA-binding transcriptional LysR family regulator
MLRFGMQFEALQVYCDIARLHSFSQAAQANGLTQSAASQVVRQIEKRLGTTLINRSIRPLQLTTQGQLFFDGCKDLVEKYRELEAAVRHAPLDVATSVQVAAIYSVGLRNMNQYVRLFSHEYPRASVHIEYLHPDRVYERVLDGSADLGLVSFPCRSRDLLATPWRDEPMGVVCFPSHPFARRRTLAPSELHNQPFVHFDRDLAIRRKVDQYLRQLGVRPRIQAEFDNIENIKHAVDMQTGIAFLPIPMVAREVKAGTLVVVPLDAPPLVRPLAIIERRRSRISSLAQRFRQLLLQTEDSGLHPQKDGTP